MPWQTRVRRIHQLEQLRAARLKLHTGAEHLQTPHRRCRALLTERIGEQFLRCVAVLTARHARVRPGTAKYDMLPR